MTLTDLGYEYISACQGPGLYFDDRVFSTEAPRNIERSCHKMSQQGATLDHFHGATFRDMESHVPENLLQAGHTTQDMKPGLALAEELFHKMLHLRILSESSDLLALAPKSCELGYEPEELSDADSYTDFNSEASSWSSSCDAEELVDPEVSFETGFWADVGTTTLGPVSTEWGAEDLSCALMDEAEWQLEAISHTPMNASSPHRPERTEELLLPWDC